MSLSIGEVDKISKLARINFADSEKQKLQKELSDILNYVDQLKELEGRNIPLDIDKDSLNLVRDDIAIQSENPEEFLNQAPDREGKFIKVKSVLD
jgi:aspartyl-tRNA(Asn)/glutamyl-tRNA(Gln) amidotransferase subunit C